MKFQKTALCVLGIFAALALTSCGKKKQHTYSERAKRDTSNDYIITVEQDLEKDEGTQPAGLYDFSGQIIILFGEGYNDETYVKSLMSMIEEKFGPTEQGDLIVPIVYPTDLKDEKITSATSFTERTTAGFIILGSPASTDLMTTKLMDEYYGKINYPVISLMPADTSMSNMLGQEASVTMLLEYGKKSISKDTRLKYSQELVMNSLSLIIGMQQEFGYKANFKIGGELIIPATYIAGEDHKVKAHVDKVMNIPSINHFVID